MPPDIQENSVEQQDYVSSEKARGVFSADAQAKLNKASNILEHPDQFADVFEKVAGTQIKVNQVICEKIKHSLSSDIDVRKTLKEIIKEVEKEEMWIWGKKIGFAAWTILILIAGAFIAKFIK